MCGSDARSPAIARQLHARLGTAAAFKMRRGLPLGEGLTLYRDGRAFRIAADDVAVPGRFETPLEAIDTARSEENARG